LFTPTGVEDIAGKGKEPWLTVRLALRRLLSPSHKDAAEGEPSLPLWASYSSWAWSSQ